MRSSSPFANWIGLLCLTLSLLTTSAVSIRELRNTPGLTPETFAAYFKNFEFRFRAKVQAHKTFLSSRSGDCDDYSTLAAQVLKERGYTPRLIAVRMPKVVHVVCYIEETKSYLDYDLRTKKRPVAECEPDIEAIAAKVAEGYKSRWTSASEFTYQDGVKRLVATVLPDKKAGTAVAAVTR